MFLERLFTGFRFWIRRRAIEKKRGVLKQNMSTNEVLQILRLGEPHKIETMPDEDDPTVAFTIWHYYRLAGDDFDIEIAFRDNKYTYSWLVTYSSEKARQIR